MATQRNNSRTATVAATQPREVVQEALQTTFILKGTLKRAQLMYLRIGELLVKVRDRKLYEALKHPDMGSYAVARLGLSRTSLYNYLRVYEWVKRSHPEWLKPKAGVFVPDLSDIGDLIWIESELARPNVPAARRAALQKLRQQGLAGKLLQSDMRQIRRRQNSGTDGLQGFASSLRTLRRRAAQLATMPPEALAHLDAAIQIILNDHAIQKAGLAQAVARESQGRRGFLVA